MLDIQKYGKVLGRGFAATLAPSILKGVLVELFRTKKVDVKKATLWIETNKSLLGSFDSEYKRQIKHLASTVGDVSWLTTDWAINCLRKDFPAVASLFLGWPKGETWLKRQIEEIKNELQE